MLQLHVYYAHPGPILLHWALIQTRLVFYAPVERTIPLLVQVLANSVFPVLLGVFRLLLVRQFPQAVPFVNQELMPPKLEPILHKLVCLVKLAAFHPFQVHRPLILAQFAPLDPTLLLVYHHVFCAPKAHLVILPMLQCAKIVQQVNFHRISVQPAVIHALLVALAALAVDNAPCVQLEHFPTKLVKSMIHRAYPVSAELTAMSWVHPSVQRALPERILNHRHFAPIAHWERIIPSLVPHRSHNVYLAELVLLLQALVLHHVQHVLWVIIPILQAHLRNLLANCVKWGNTDRMVTASIVHQVHIRIE